MKDLQRLSEIATKTTALYDEKKENRRTYYNQLWRQSFIRLDISDSLGLDYMEPKSYFDQYCYEKKYMITWSRSMDFYVSNGIELFRRSTERKYTITSQFVRTALILFMKEKGIKGAVIGNETAPKWPMLALQEFFDFFIDNVKSGEY